MKTSRRHLLRAGLGATAVACAGKVPLLIQESVAALPRSETDGRILVVIELDGGNDGLNTVVPFGDDIYYRSRPTLGIPASDVLKIDDHVGFHPSARGLASLFEAEQLAVVQSVGYPNPNRSHFESMSIWHTGTTDAKPGDRGWLSHFVDQRTKPGQVDPVALHVDEATLAQALIGSDVQIPSVSELQHLHRHIGVPTTSNPAKQRAMLDRVISQRRGIVGSHLEFIQQNTAISYASSARLKDLLNENQSSGSVRYPPGLGQRLEMIARLIRAELGTSIYYARLAGFDTHADQRFAHANLLSELGEALATFYKDLKEAGIAERVVTFAFSEFGRRLHENGSKGTDHGTAGPVFLVGSTPKLKAGLLGPYPDLANLVDKDPVHQIDFRSLYADLVTNWIGAKDPAFKEFAAPKPLVLEA